MARRIVIEFQHTADVSSSVHQIRNFGEALYRACVADGWASLPLADVDRATDRLQVDVYSKRRVRRVCRMINDLLGRHFLANRARVSEIDGPD